MSILHRPYPINDSVRVKLLISVLFGIFIFGFLAFFQPFGLYNWKDPDKLIKLGGYGVATTLGLGFNSIVLPLFIPYLRKESNWTVLHEILHTLGVIFMIAFLNTLYSYLLGLTGLNFSSIISYVFITFMVSILPVSLFIMINYYRLQQRYTRNADRLNRLIDQKETHIPASLPSRITLNIDGLLIDSKDFIYAKASDNYLEVYFIKNEALTREIIRHTLKQLQEAGANDPHLFRCHRSYLVNLTFVEQVSGNSQGQKLRLKYTEVSVPVSRSLNQLLGEKLKMGN